MELQTKSNVSVSKLFISNSLEVKEEFEEKFERSFQLVEGHLAAHQNDKELHEVLSKLVCNDKQHEEVSIGLLYVILTSTDHQITAKTYRDLTLVNRDGLNTITNNLSILVCEKYQKLTEVARRQLLWLLRELVKNQVNNADGVMFNCLRQASGGDISAKNLLLVEGLLDIFIEFRQWLDKFPFLISTVIFSYVRLIEDHMPAHLNQLRDKEVKFVIQLIRDRFMDVIPLGRDFVRLLQNVSRIPEFNQLWKDILNNPKSLASSFNGIWHLLQIRTSRRFFQCRLTPEVERKFHYLVSSVKFGNQRRYQEWFQERYFSTPESQTLRSDLIRFLVNVIHPTNEVLCSDIIPRWAVIGWLLTSCTNPTAMANAKLALFYDWLVFDPNKDNIMNIEPGILVMYHSIKTHPLVTNTLLDFLVRIMKNFFPKYEDKIKMGIHNSFRKILEKQVVPNLGPLFEFPKLDKDLKAQLQICFSEFYTGMPISPSPQTNPSMFIPMDSNNLHMQMGKRPEEPVCGTAGESLFNNYNPFDPHIVLDKGAAGAGGSGSATVTVKDKEPGDKDTVVVKDEQEEQAVFSDEDEEKEVKNEDFTDDDDDLPLSKVRLKEKPLPEKVDLPPTIQESWNKFLLKRNTPTLEEFLTDFKTISASAINDEQHDYIVDNLGIILKQKLPQNFFPDSKNDEKLLQESINFPIFQIFRTMYLSEEKLKKPFVLLLSGLYEKIPAFGYLLLYFLKVFSKLQTRKSQQSQNQQNASSSGTGSGAGGGSGQITSFPFKVSLYKQLCESIEEKMDKCLVRDLQALENEYSHIFIWLITDVYREFKSIVVNNSDIIRIILSSIDAKNLRDLIYNVIQGKLIMFKTDSLIDCIRKSLAYETFEQVCFWQLLQAHDIPFEYFQDIIPDLESNHAEALTNMLLLLKNEEPTPELSRLLLSRETKVRGDPFITSTLRFWCQNYEEKLSSIIAGLLTSKYPNSSPNKRKRPMKNSSSNNNTPTSDQLLNHLEHFRRSCRHGNGTGTGLYVQDTMQRALQQAFSHSSDSVKKQYSDLFGLAAEEDTSSVSRRGERGRGRKQASSKKDTNNSTSGNKKNQEAAAATVYSSEDDSEDDWTKRKPPKRRKKAISESD